MFLSGLERQRGSRVERRVGRCGAWERIEVEEEERIMKKVLRAERRERSRRRGDVLGREAVKDGGRAISGCWKTVRADVTSPVPW